MHVNGMICLEDNGGTTRELQKVVCKEDTAGGRYDSFLDSDDNKNLHNDC